MINWKTTDNGLFKEFVFSDFRDAYTFMTKVAFLAEELNHHPDWRNVYNKVSIYLNTHDAGGIITEQDREMSRRIDELL